MDTHQKIVALYRTNAEAQEAMTDLESNGIPRNDIILSATDGGVDNKTEAAPRPEPGFWASLFGEGDEVPQRDRDFYQSGVNERGYTLLSVRVSLADSERIMKILIDHNPVELSDDDAMAETTTAAMADAPNTSTATTASSTRPTGDTVVGDEQVIPLAKEEIQVGKRQSSRARAYRIRTTVTETPVQQDVNLRDETVTVERRPATGRTATGDALREQTIEVTEKREEPVVSKVVKPTEEVVVRKEQHDRSETVRDTVRESHVDVEEDMAGNKPASKTTSKTKKPEPM